MLEERLEEIRHEKEEERRESERQRKEEEKRRRMEERGHFGYRLFTSQNTIDFFDSCVDDDVDKQVSCLAIGDDIFCCIYDDGGFSYSGGLPTGLYNSLHGRQPDHPSPTFVALGCDEQYFIKFSNGSSRWCVIDEDLDDFISNNSIETLSFHPNFTDTYFVMDTNGYYEWKGSIHRQLEKQLRNSPSESNIENVRLGSNYNYHISYDTHVDYRLDKCYTKGIARNRLITDVIFGPKKRGGDLNYAIRLC